ncbi:hypothetical protein HJB82_00395 [Rhizobium sp. NZLR10]|uniref:hypothetical protein n=1 Tax=Rhizobium sp. NZLR10 TaxID=2731097 RepID=UPI001C828EE1|nr:hypothetical protein [Rhizobium sp. NZLR10]MBX5193795.1 hypothetical protein [Rhizobium sp. NZLR10]
MIGAVFSVFAPADLSTLDTWPLSTADSVLKQSARMAEVKLIFASIAENYVVTSWA